MEISQLTASQTDRADIPPATENDAGSVIGADFETFLRMLTTQLQNQDPLNPIKSSDYAVQLATFSGVEQQVLTNDLLRGLGAEGALSGLADYADWVGMEARAKGPVPFAGEPVTLHFDIPAAASTAELVVKSPAGAELHRHTVTGHIGPYVWDGRSPSGTLLLEGRYELSLETKTASGDVSTHPVSSFSRVDEVRAGRNGPEILLAHGETVAASDVTALRAP